MDNQDLQEYTAAVSESPNGAAPGPFSTSVDRVMEKYTERLTAVERELMVTLAALEQLNETLQEANGRAKHLQWELSRARDSETATYERLEDLKNVTSDQAIIIERYRTAWGAPPQAAPEPSDEDLPQDADSEETNTEIAHIDTRSVRPNKGGRKP